MDKESDTKQKFQVAQPTPTIPLTKNNGASDGSAIGSVARKATGLLNNTLDKDKQNIGKALKLLSDAFPGNTFIQIFVICIVILILLLSSGFVGYFVHPSSSSPPPSRFTNFPDVVHFGCVNYGVVHNVTIIGTYTKNITATGENGVDFCNTKYMVGGTQVIEPFKV